MAVVWCIGHRGAMADYPENTLGGIELAAVRGADMVEIDVQFSRDGHLVVMHDETVDRTTNGHGRVADLTLDELRALDAGQGERIPTLAEVLDLCHRLELGLNIEIKAPEAADAVAELVKSVPGPTNVVLGSFSPEAVLRVRDSAPAVPRALITGHSRPMEQLVRQQMFPLDILEDLHCEALHAELPMVTPWLVEHLHRHGYRIRVWTVDNPADMRRLVRLGVDGIFSNRPGLLVETVRETSQ